MAKFLDFVIYVQIAVLLSHLIVISEGVEKYSFSLEDIPSQALSVSGKASPSALSKRLTSIRDKSVTKVKRRTTLTVKNAHDLITTHDDDWIQRPNFESNRRRSRTRSNSKKRVRRESRKDGFYCIRKSSCWVNMKVKIEATDDSEISGTASLDEEATASLEEAISNLLLKLNIPKEKVVQRKIKLRHDRDDVYMYDVELKVAYRSMRSYLKRLHTIDKSETAFENGQATSNILKDDVEDILTESSNSVAQVQTTFEFVQEAISDVSNRQIQSRETFEERDSDIILLSAVRVPRNCLPMKNCILHVTVVAEVGVTLSIIRQAILQLRGVPNFSSVFDISSITVFGLTGSSYLVEIPIQQNYLNQPDVF